MSAAARSAIDPLVELARRFTIDWLDRADTSVPAEIMSSDYTIHIGGIDMAGLDAYTEATSGQLQRFPGLQLTIHDLITDGDRLALVFTEHGASVKDGLNPAAWSGVTLFRSDGGRFVENWTQEDYYSRRRQLRDGRADVIAAPAPAPWTTAPAAPSPDALSAARAWLAAPTFEDIRLDDALESQPALEVESVDVVEIFTAGDRVAFDAVWTGSYRGTLAGLPDAGAAATLGVAGVLDVVDKKITSGRIVTDRLGLHKSLRTAGELR